MGGEEAREREWLEAEERVRERVGADGSRWTKVYVGGGAHLASWLDQCLELAGEENVETEVIEPGGLACYAEAGEPLTRIWVRDGAVGARREPP